MKILLLGKNGLLGSEFAAAFKKTSHSLFAFGHAELDITDFDKTNALISDMKPDFIINTAGYTKVDQAETDKELCFAVNAYAVENLAKISKACDIPLLHLSTDYVFDGLKKQGYLESDLANPINVYGESKTLGENLLIANAAKFFLVRSSWIFGKYGKNFVSTILDLAKKEQKLRIVNDQSGKPTYSFDLANACLRFLDSQEYGIYHIVNEQAVSWYEYAKIILKQAGIEKEIIPITSEELKRPTKRPSYSILINSKLPHLRPWPAALKSYLQTITYNP